MKAKKVVKAQVESIVRRPKCIICKSANIDRTCNNFKKNQYGLGGIAMIAGIGGASNVKGEAAGTHSHL